MRWTELEALDIEGEWDPTTHDTQMANIYGAGADADADADAASDVSMTNMLLGDPTNWTIGWEACLERGHRCLGHSPS